MKRTLFLLFALTHAAILFAQTPEITSWVINPGSETGYAGILSNVQTVQYSSSNVYISCTCIPGYSIGPWSNPNVASNQNFVFKITRNPVKNSGAATAVGLGHIGIWSNGVSIFNADDAQTYNNQGVWHRNAYYWEKPSFDNCLGHAQQQGEYHHHVNPKCLYDVTDSIHHSPLIGYMFDGFPVYGAYAYSDTAGNGPIKRMRTSYQLRNITTRTKLPNGDTTYFPGPAVGGQYPLGAYIQDYVYVAGSGDLDANNGRFCVTPEYPNGIYAYFVSIDSALNPVYPYTAGVNYYGVVQAGNTGMNSGHNTISEAVTTYTPVTTGIAEPIQTIKYQLYPNPVKDYAYIYFDVASANNVKGAIYDINGRMLQSINNLQPTISYTFDLSTYPAGVYLLHLESEGQKIVEKIIKTD